MYSLGNKIKELRTKRDLTQDQLANQLNEMFGTNINKGMISKWENGHEDPSLDNGRKIVTFFGITLDELLGLNEPEETHNESDNLTEEEILTMAAHRIGHDGPLAPEQLVQIKLALKIALAKENNQ